jgi:MFS family permease
MRRMSEEHGAVAPGGTTPLRRVRIGILALLAASGLSGLGDILAAIALPWFVLQETGSPALTALTGFASLVPLVVGGIVGGAVVDRFGFRPVSVVADLVERGDAGARPAAGAFSARSRSGT